MANWCNKTNTLSIIDCIFFLLKADDTRKWRSELNNLGKRIGIMTSEEIKNENESVNKIKSEAPLDPRIVKSLDFQRSNTFLDHKMQTGRKKTVQDNSRDEQARTGRFNESRYYNMKKGAASRLKTNASTSKNKVILCAEEEEREMFVS